MNNIWFNNEKYDDAIYEYLGTSFDNTIYSTVLGYFLQNLSANAIQDKNQDKKDRKLYEPILIVDEDTIVQLYILTCQFIKYPLFDPFILQKYNNPSKILCHMIPGSYDIITKLGGTFKPITEEYIKECIESWEERNNMSITDYINSLLPYMEVSNNIINNRYSSIIMNFSKYRQPGGYDQTKPLYCMGLYDIFEYYRKNTFKECNNEVTKVLDGLLETENAAEYILKALSEYSNSVCEQYGNFLLGASMEYFSCIKTDFFDTNSMVISIDQYCNDDFDKIAYISLKPTTGGFIITFNFKLNTSHSDYNKEAYYKDEIKINSGESNLYNLIDNHIIDSFISNFEKEYIDKMEEDDEDDCDDIINFIESNILTNSEIEYDNGKLEKELTPTEIFDKYYNEAIQNGLSSDNAIDYAKKKSKEFFDNSKNQ